MMNLIHRYLTELVSLTNEMSPYLLLGFLFAGILHVFVRKERISHYLGGRNLKSVLYAALLGVPLPLCSCGVIPTGISFYNDGASKGATVSFLISTPQTGLDSIMVTYSLLGLPFTIIRPIVALITGVIGGVFTNAATPSTGKAASQQKTVGEEDCHCHTAPQRGKIAELFHYAFVDFLQDIAKWLIIGLLLAAMISVVLPEDFFASYIGNDLLGMLIIVVASVPLYVCATGSVPIGAVLLAKGLSPGAVLAFLMAGPATNAATITVLGKALGRKSLTVYLTTIILGSLLFGFLIDQFLPREWFYDNIAHLHGHAHQMIPTWISGLSSIVLTALLVNGLVKKQGWFRKQAKQKISNGEIVLRVKGMTCNHCKETVELAVKQCGQIQQVHVDLTSGLVTVWGSQANRNAIIKSIEERGYSVELVTN